ncbi:mannose-1-phosphate guanylyltransferase/mannose-6-phosphate isomerase [Vineibacter terrae]|uniref:mannose-1-phosphate guanylyltransferase/mannose-6-phosphate isomerase n=1 Tax=Vineibacter terrae TaxID=2586908 RepID=UPI002E342665|nr:mannose-1-phosphate guanylyltransferase/mannose-6-phosphate isomerase [Vineibacter terrae]HEX2890289.1 mannose-1-phosphate guanylyltransferase/mannose-6-phosphate isomerase [Vineibacter terrae]
MDTIADLARFRVQGAAVIHPVILSGGSGTRLWPLSRAAYPKQLLPLLSERTMLQETALRSMTDVGFAAPIVICNDEHRFLIDEQLRQVGVVPQQVMLEPVARNTGPAVAAAALWLIARDPDALMLVQPSDHVIGSVARFHEAIARGVGAAQSGKLVTFGIKPDRPDTGYGYIQTGQALEDAEGVFLADRFVEKPDRATAERFVDSGVFSWNSGIFLIGARHFLEDLGRLNPEMLAACERAVHKGTEDLGFFRLDAAALSEAPSLSIDRAVMELTDRAAVVPVDMAWNDLGSWRALQALGSQDGDGNVVQGDVMLDRVRNSYIRSDSKLVAAIDVEDVVVVSTDDAVLVARADSAADVSGIVERLRRENRSEPIQHTTTYRPWGYYRTVDAGSRFQVKRIMVKPGAKLSLQMHFHRAEHWVVVQGTAMVQRGDDRMLVRENESIYIPIGTAHRLENPGKLPLHLIEVQSGPYLGEDDIVRIADNYGRA